MIVMSLVVFVDVVHRSGADPESRPAKWLGRVIAAVSGADQATLYPTLRDWVVPPLLFLFAAALVYTALRWRTGDEALSKKRGLVVALGVSVGAYVAVKALIFLLPNGVVWAQTLALVLTLWVGFTGASICTFEGRHLRVEAADKLWPARMRPYVTALANLVSAQLVLSLAVLSARFVRTSYGEYVQTNGHGGVFGGMPILPEWLGYIILPLSFSVMAARFFAVSISALRGGRYGRGGPDPVQALLDEAGVSVGAAAPAEAGDLQLNSGEPVEGA